MKYRKACLVLNDNLKNTTALSVITLNPSNAFCVTALPCKNLHRNFRHVFTVTNVTVLFWQYLCQRSFKFQAFGRIIPDDYYTGRAKKWHPCQLRQYNVI